MTDNMRPVTSPFRHLLRAASVLSASLLMAAPTWAQLSTGLSAGYLGTLGDGAGGGVSVTLSFAPFPVSWGAIGFELGLDRMGLDEDSLQLAVDCVGPSGVTGCSFRSRLRETTLHVALFTRFGRPARGARLFGEFGLGFYQIREWFQEDAWTDDGTFLPNLSLSPRSRTGDSGLGAHGVVGLRYQPGNTPFAVTLALRGRLAEFLTGDLETDSRNAAGIVAGVSWN